MHGEFNNIQWIFFIAEYISRNRSHFTECPSFQEPIGHHFPTLKGSQCTLTLNQDVVSRDESDCVIPLAYPLSLTLPAHLPHSLILLIISVARRNTGRSSLSSVMTSITSGFVETTIHNEIQPFTLICSKSIQVCFRWYSSLMSDIDICRLSLQMIPWENLVSETNVEVVRSMSLSAFIAQVWLLCCDS